ncbi:hypothetical protein BPOR_0681g00020 [Botrytis porri]|uniref:Uncharacterized protein n=1 Tax=Botrytis porri TaxID=87229 RepID=A0A4Z1KAR6_9HELO|nr:hypothetical protein BPOR_0681g00020 [Botrytis porri]
MPHYLLWLGMASSRQDGREDENKPRLWTRNRRLGFYVDVKETVSHSGLHGQESKRDIGTNPVFGNPAVGTGSGGG